MGANPKQEALRLFERALILPAGERNEFLQAECGGQSQLLAHVQALLASAESAKDIFPTGLPQDASTNSALSDDTASPSTAQSALLLKRGFTLSNRYTVTATLGSGGMGEVYRATDSRLSREVAIKVLNASGQRDPEMQERFDNEMKSIAALSHPNIVTLYDLIEEGDRRFAIMELVEGQTLRSLIGEGVGWREAVGIFSDVAAGLKAAHRLDLMHRDIKPENVINA